MSYIKIFEISMYTKDLEILLKVKVPIIFHGTVGFSPRREGR
jgi:hypothetical protein